MHRPIFYKVDYTGCLKEVNAWKKSEKLILYDPRHPVRGFRSFIVPRFVQFLTKSGTFSVKHIRITLSTLGLWINTQIHKLREIDRERQILHKYFLKNLTETVLASRSSDLTDSECTFLRSCDIFFLKNLIKQLTWIAFAFM